METTQPRLAMTNELLLIDNQRKAIEEAVTLSRLHETTVESALEIICRDSAVSPLKYLADTTVPHGGE